MPQLIFGLFILALIGHFAVKWVKHNKRHNLIEKQKDRLADLEAIEQALDVEELLLIKEDQLERHRKEVIK